MLFFNPELRPRVYFEVLILRIFEVFGGLRSSRFRVSIIKNMII